MAGMTRIDPKPTGTSHTRASEMATPALTRKELLERLRIEFPDAGHAVGDFEIEELWRGGCRLRQRYDKRGLRPVQCQNGNSAPILAKQNERRLRGRGGCGLGAHVADMFIGPTNSWS